MDNRPLRRLWPIFAALLALVIVIVIVGVLLAS
jgi:hypothetical protein